MEFTIRIDNPAFTTSVKSPLKIEVNRISLIGFSGQESREHCGGLQGCPRRVQQRQAHDLLRRSASMGILLTGRVTKFIHYCVNRLYIPNSFASPFQHSLKPVPVLVLLYFEPVIRLFFLVHVEDLALRVLNQSSLDLFLPNFLPK
jgi:hypothetical protein